MLRRLVLRQRERLVLRQRELLVLRRQELLVLRRLEQLVLRQLVLRQLVLQRLVLRRLALPQLVLRLPWKFRQRPSFAVHRLGCPWRRRLGGRWWARCIRCTNRILPTGCQRKIACSR